MKQLLFIFLIVILYINTTNAYKNKEIVRVSLQTMIGIGGTIENHDISSKLAPRFNTDLSKRLLAVETGGEGKRKVEILPNVLYRILFSFDNDKFKTSWITVCDGNGTYLNHIDFNFIYSNDKILDLKWHLDYNTEEVHHKKKPSDFYIKYRWNEIKDKDLSMGLGVLFFFGFIISTISILHIVSQSVTPKKILNSSKALPSFYKQSDNNNNNNNNYYNNNNNRQQTQYNLSPPTSALSSYQEESNFIDTSKPTQQQSSYIHSPTIAKIPLEYGDEEIPNIEEMETLN